MSELLNIHIFIFSNKALQFKIKFIIIFKQKCWFESSRIYNNFKKRTF